MITEIPSTMLAKGDATKTSSTPAIPTGTSGSFMSLLMARLGQMTLKPPAQPALPVQAPQPPPGEEKMKEIFSVVLRHEGLAYVRHDAGEESSKFGILQATAARYGYTGDVKNMSQAQAEDVYRNIWVESGAADMPSQLALVHFDTYINSPAAAKKMLKQSGGDANLYLQMRSQRYARLTQANPARFGRYAKGWMNRIQSLKNTLAANQKTFQSEKSRPT